MEVEGNRPRGRPRKTWMKTEGRYEKICSVNAEKLKFVEREGPWCETANLAKCRNTGLPLEPKFLIFLNFF
jgi:hypothetical protein